jgi:hypothetical protein
MPTAVMAQPISTAPTSALAAMFCGSEKIPPPIIEPTTSATSAPSLVFRGFRHCMTPMQEKRDNRVVPLQSIS